MSSERIEPLTRTIASAEAERMSANELQLREYRELLSSRELEFENYRARLKEEHLKRERQFQRELEERDRFFSEREKKFAERQRDFEKRLSMREVESESLRERLHVEIADRESRLQKALSDLKQEKARYKEESLKKVEKTSKSYVSDAIEILDRRENQFHFMSKLWSFVGVLGIVAGLALLFYVSARYSPPANSSWELLTFYSFKGVVIIALVAALAKYSFLFSSRYMQEALKNSDRRHAINFGKFYLESYGAAAEWSQVKEAFEHWNISEASAFGKGDGNGGEIESLERSVSIIERLGKIIPK
nr:hypothetical protein [Stenotrophomonas geniculata]